MRMWNTSPRSTAPNQMLARGPMPTSPMMVAVSATNAVGSTSGTNPRKPRMRPRCNSLIAASHLPLAELVVGQGLEQVLQMRAVAEHFGLVALAWRAGSRLARRQIDVARAIDDLAGDADARAGAH